MMVMSEWVRAEGRGRGKRRGEERRRIGGEEKEEEEDGMGGRDQATSLD